MVQGESRVTLPVYRFAQGKSHYAMTKAAPPTPSHNAIVRPRGVTGRVRRRLVDVCLDPGATAQGLADNLQRIGDDALVRWPPANTPGAGQGRPHPRSP
jgi:hypothetical protein